MKAKKLTLPVNFWKIGVILSFILPMILASIYWISANQKGVSGFPLDDAWIHQTYARNLAVQGKWMYQAGGGAGGSTSPLWTMMLAPIHWINDGNPVLFTNILSAILFGLLVWLGVRWIRKNTQDQKLSVVFGVLILSLSWQLNWAANSGMETLSYALLAVLVFTLSLSQEGKFPFWTGIAIGIAVWIRPDAITLLAPVGLIYLLQGTHQKISLKSVMKLVGGVVFPIGCYGAWNILQTGSFFPNTFFAKQAEYSELLSLPLFERLVNVSLPVLTGAIVLLVPGIVYAAVNSIKQKNFHSFAVFLWCLGYAGMYALRLPVSYQHGRYLMPVIAPLILLGVIGIIQIKERVQAGNILRRVLLPVWMISTILVSGIFWLKGLNLYCEDVSAINRLMVESSLWIKDNTPVNAKIAVHDIGAMGYFSDREIIDLAGLINPEVIPFIRDEEELAEYIKEQNADYLVIMKDWYPSLEKMNGKEVASFEAESGGEVGQMLIFQLNQ